MVMKALRWVIVFGLGVSVGGFIMFRITSSETGNFSETESSNEAIALDPSESSETDSENSGDAEDQADTVESPAALDPLSSLSAFNISPDLDLSEVEPTEILPHSDPILCESPQLCLDENAEFVQRLLDEGLELVGIEASERRNPVDEKVVLDMHDAWVNYRTAVCVFDEELKRGTRAAMRGVSGRAARDACLYRMNLDHTAQLIEWGQNIDGGGVNLFLR